MSWLLVLIIAALAFLVYLILFGTPDFNAMPGLSDILKDENIDLLPLSLDTDPRLTDWFMSEHERAHGVFVKGNIDDAIEIYEPITQQGVPSAIIDINMAILLQTKYILFQNDMAPKEKKIFQNTIDQYAHRADQLYIVDRDRYDLDLED